MLMCLQRFESVLSQFNISPKPTVYSHVDLEGYTSFLLSPSPHLLLILLILMQIRSETAHLLGLLTIILLQNN